MGRSPDQGGVDMFMSSADIIVGVLGSVVGGAAVATVQFAARRLRERGRLFTGQWEQATNSKCCDFALSPKHIALGLAPKL